MLYGGLVKNFENTIYPNFGFPLFPFLIYRVYPFPFLIYMQNNKVWVFNTFYKKEVDFLEGIKHN